MIDTVCPEDDILMTLVAGEECADAIPHHVAQCLSCQRRVQQLQLAVNHIRGLVSATEQTVAGSPVPGPSMIGKYFVVGVLGQGGQATVYRAVHPTLGNDLAIKLSPWVVELTEAQRDLLAAEARLLADLDHPNLARVFDLDFHEGRPFVAMEYIRGLSLAQSYAQAQPKLNDAATLVAQLARAVAAAHRRGVTHQDIKPDNVVLDDVGQPHLIDFGLARLRHAWGSAGEQLIGGTPGFMSPEQLRCNKEQVSPRSDIFGLGGVLYWLLAQEPPLPAIADIEPPGPVDLSPLTRAAAPRALVAICKRALAFDPAERYATADELADDLERFLRQPHRRKVIAVATLGLAAVLALTAGLTLLLVPPRPTQPTQRVFPTQPQYLITEAFRGMPPARLGTVKGASPLQSGDTLAISCRVPNGFIPRLFLYDSGTWSEVTLKEVDQTRDGATDKLSLNIKFDCQGSGTAILLVCAGQAGALTLEDVKSLVGMEPLPDLDAPYVVRFDLVSFHEREWAARGSTRQPPKVVDQLEKRLSRLREQLVERCEFFAGIAFMHGEWKEDQPDR